MNEIPEWIYIGAIVNYHSIIGEQPTQKNMIVRDFGFISSNPELVVWLEGKPGCVALKALSKII